MTDTDDGLREFVEREWEPLVRLAYLLTGDRGHAEDLVQAALEKTHRRWDRVARMDAPIAYVRRVMVNTAISWRRRRRPVEVALLAGDGPVSDPYGPVDRDRRGAARAGADNRPLAWRMRAEGKDDRTDRVVVVVPPGTGRATMTVAGAAPIPLTLDPSGSAVTTLDPDAAATVTAYPADGSAAAGTPVPPFETDSGGLPGDTPKTRVVN